MTPETLVALKASIQHWHENAAADRQEDVRIGSSNCALCDAFLDYDCAGCPIEATGHHLCGDTPYGTAATALNLWAVGVATRDAFRDAARAEIQFLESLLPANTR